MELIVISESKIKIMLTEPDMQYYRLNASNMNCADVCTQAAFRHIFEDAHREVGFDTEGKRLFIQLYTSIEGGCEIFVTKLDKHTQSEEDVRLPEGITADHCGKSRDVLAVYTATIGIKKTKSALLIGLFCDLVAFLVAVWIWNFLI